MSWQKTKISEFLTERKDRFKPDKANELGLPRIEKIDFSGTIYINNFKPTKTGMILVKNGDLVISGINVEKGALAIYKGNTDALATIHYSSYTYDENKIDIDFLKWYLQSNIFRNILKEQVKGGIKTEIKPKTFLNLEIMLPDLTTQKKIASKLNKLEWNVKDLDFTCFCNKELIDKLRQSILQEAIQGQLVPQNPNDEPASELLKRIKAEKEDLIKDKKLKRDKKDYQILKHDNGKYYEKIGNVLKNITEQIPYSIPYNWQWVKIRNISFVTKLAGFEYTKYMRLTDKGDVPVIRAQNVKSAKLDLTNLKYINSDTSTLLERSSLNKECLLMTFIGAGIGDIAIFNMNKRFHLAPNVAKIEIYNKYENIDNKYIMYYLLSKTGKKEIFKFLKATAQPSLSMDTIREIYVPIPPLAEQERIVRKVDELMQLCDKLENENNNAQKASSELLQAIMQKYFTPEA